MANIIVGKQIGTGIADGLNVVRGEQIEVAYGTVDAADYAVADVIKFSKLPMKKLLYAKFASAYNTLELDHATDLSSNIAFDVEGSGVAIDFTYRIEYVRGSSGQGEDGVIKLAIASGAS